MAAFQALSVGRIVHYYRDGRGPKAAIVVGTLGEDNMVGTLQVFEPDGAIDLVENVHEKDTALKVNLKTYWTWPPRT